MNESRTINSLKNIKSGFLVQFINKVLSFVSRSIFIYILGTEYLGINGLFSNVLSILSFAELGIGSAIIYNMYKPVATQDKEKTKSLMKLYKKSYNIIAIVILGLGILVIPFLDFIIKDVPLIKINIKLIYLLFLLDTVCSYFFTYKKSIIIAHQKQHIINYIDSIFYLLKNVIQISLLYITKNYILYLIIQIISTLFENIYISNKANKLYPYLKDKDVKNLDKDEKKGIFNNIKSLAIYQFGAVIMNGTDNIIISSMVGVTIVGLCSNYTMILTSLKQVISTALNGLTASVGNLNATSTVEKKENIYNQLTLAYYLLYSFCSISFIGIVTSFIDIWLGKKYLLDYNIAISLGITLFVEGIRMPGFMFRTTLGLFEKARITPYIGAISNIILSIVLCKYWGVVGIFIATSISQIISYFWIDPHLIYKYDFKKSPKKFFWNLFKYFLIYFINLILVVLIVKKLLFSKLINFAISLVVCLIIPNVINLLFFHKSEEFIALKDRVISRFAAKIRKEHINEETI